MNKLCSGCGACINICPKQCIELKENKDGFYEAFTERTQCVECGMCEKVCPFNNKADVFKNVVEAGYYYSSSEQNRKKSSSGGLCGDIIRVAYNDGYAAAGAIYNSSKNLVEHKEAQCFEETEEFKGSKYLQSNPMAMYNSVEEDDCVVIGTPCQIAGVRRYIQLKKLKRRYILVDFYCHGVPSYHLWRKYLKANALKHPLTEISFRDKRHGWNDYVLFCQNEEKAYVSSYKKDKDFFYTAFLANMCLNKVCYNDCPFRGENSYADIRLGDAWGKDVAGDNLGVSTVAVFTETGKDMLEKIKKEGTFLHTSIQEATAAQIHSGIKMPHSRNKFIDALQSGKDLDYLRLKYLLPQRIKKSILIRVNKFRRKKLNSCLEDRNDR